MRTTMATRRMTKAATSRRFERIARLCVRAKRMLHEASDLAEPAVIDAGSWDLVADALLNDIGAAARTAANAAMLADHLRVKALEDMGL